MLQEVRLVPCAHRGTTTEEILTDISERMGDAGHRGTSDRVLLEARSPHKVGTPRPPEAVPPRAVLSVLSPCDTRGDLPRPYPQHVS